MHKWTKVNVSRPNPTRYTTYWTQLNPVYCSVSEQCDMTHGELYYSIWSILLLKSASELQRTYVKFLQVTVRLLCNSNTRWPVSTRLLRRHFVAHKPDQTHEKVITSDPIRSDPTHGLTQPMGRPDHELTQAIVHLWASVMHPISYRIISWLMPTGRSAAHDAVDVRRKSRKRRVRVDRKWRHSPTAVGRSAARTRAVRHQVRRYTIRYDTIR